MKRILKITLEGYGPDVDYIADYVIKGKASLQAFGDNVDFKVEEESLVVGKKGVEQ